MLLPVTAPKPCGVGPEDAAASSTTSSPRVAERHLELGDPGVTHDRDTARADLPPYVGPVDPPAGHVHEWGAQVADQADDAPLEGPALAPYAQAGADGEGI